MSNCLFCKIASRTIPAQILFENADTMAFRDIHSVAPAHALVVPKAHIAGMHEADGETLGRVLAAAREVAVQLGLASTGYRLVINEGADAGQSVFHLHCHVLGGRPLAWPPG